MPRVDDVVDHRRLIKLIGGVLALVILTGMGVFWLLKSGWLSPKLNPAAQPVGSVGVTEATQEQIQRAARYSSVGGTVAAIDLASRHITIRESQGAKTYSFSPDVTVHVGVSATMAKLEQVAVGDNVSCLFNKETNLVEDIYVAK